MEDITMVRPRTNLTEQIDERMAASPWSLSVLDAQSGAWEVRSWPQVRERARQIGCRIADTPVTAVGLIGDPTVDLIAAVQGAWLAGAAVSILPGPIRGADEQRWAQMTYARFVDIGVGLVLGSGEHFELLASLAGDLPREPVAGFAVDTQTSGWEPVWLDGGAPAVLQGTAGSTGEPKTAVLTANAVQTNTGALVSRLGMRAETDVAFSWLPLYHDMGLTFLLASMGESAPLFIVPNSAFAAAPFKWLDWLSETKATITAAPNFAYDILGRYGKLIKDADLSRIRVSISGGEPIDPTSFDVFLDVAARFGFDPAAAAPAYGMAESTCAVTMPRAGEGAQYDDVTVTLPGEGQTPMRKRYALLGTPLAGMELRITPPTDAAVPQIDHRDVGHVQIRGTSMMTGYLGHEPLAVDEWFDTGDLGYLVDGRLVICGRTKEVVIVAGRNLFPVEIERAASLVAGVKRGGVVAMARGEGAARPGLVVVAEYRGEDPDAARAAVISEVASQCAVVPAEVIFVVPGTIPRTTSGKLRRLETTQLIAAGTLGGLVGAR